MIEGNIVTLMLRNYSVERQSRSKLPDIVAIKTGYDPDTDLFVTRILDTQTNDTVDKDYKTPSDQRKQHTYVMDWYKMLGYTDTAHKDSQMMRLAKQLESILDLDFTKEEAAKLGFVKYIAGGQ